MTTTDINGLVYYETTDNVTPLQVVLNGMSTAVTNAFDSTDRIFRVADATARDALYASRGAPLLVFREDLGTLERNGGAGWSGFVAQAPASFTPVLRAGSTPASGYTASGRYIQIGKQVTYWFAINMGAITSAADGYEITVPVPASTALSVTAGTVRLYDSSTGNAILSARTAIATSGSLGMQTALTYGGTLALVRYDVPWAWATGDIIDGFIIYEAA